MKKRTKFLLGLIVILLIAAGGAGIFYKMRFAQLAKGRLPYIPSQEKIDSLFPYDEAEAKAIDESEPNKDGETWAIYMYLNASNLELDGHTQLSSFVEYLAEEESSARIAEEKEATNKLYKDFMAAEEKNNIPMPLSFYEADYDRATADIPEEAHSVSSLAWGTSILKEIKEAEFPDNVTFVVQPGGSKAWSDPLINPNRTRRYVKEGNELVEVYDAPVTNMGDSQTLSDFLNYCKENYPADHTMVILTDHGGAMNGFGWDNIYNDDNLTLKELTTAFEDSYGIDEENPPIDLLYFNACVMSNTDVIHAMRGVSKYMIAGEEVGLTVQAYYSELAQAIKDKPNMNAKQIGKALIDNYCHELGEAGTLVGAPPSTGMGLLDMSIAPKVYDAYADLAKKMLTDLADHPELMARLSRNISKSVSFAVVAYKRYNITDLGLWIEDLKDMYPDEVNNILSLIDESVIYNRADGYLGDAKGISVHFPNYVESVAAFKTALNYIDQISYSEDISALYYYKLAGCLNDKYTAYCKENNIKVPEPINYAAMGELRNSEVTETDDQGNMKAEVPADVGTILTDARYELCKVNESADSVTYYGEDYFIAPDGDSGVKTVFEGKWVNIGGVPFAVDVINTTEDMIIYESPVKYKDYKYKLVLECQVSKDGGEDIFTIRGLRHPDDEAAKLDRNVEELEVNSTITPIYETSALTGEHRTDMDGTEVRYTEKTEIKDEPLAKGKYRARIVYEDMRGDDVYSAPVFFEVK